MNAGRQVVILDYGLGNLFNLQRAFESLGLDAVISGDRNVVLGAPRLVLPGVGAFESGMFNLKESGLIDVIHEFAGTGKPLMGICLGMQLMMAESEENGIWQGLSLIPGRVIRFRPPEPGEIQYKIPQIGWNQIELAVKNGSEAWTGTFLNGIPQGSHMYFVHSYHVVPEDSGVRLAETEYGSDRFCSALLRDNLMGCQFHPERSGPAGLRILNNFASLE